MPCADGTTAGWQALPLDKRQAYIRLSWTWVSSNPPAADPVG
jgi:hypothetical protein